MPTAHVVSEPRVTDFESVAHFRVHLNAVDQGVIIREPLPVEVLLNRHHGIILPRAPGDPLHPVDHLNSQ